MALNNTILFIALAWMTSCNGQVQTNAADNLKAAPSVIRNFKATGHAPDFDTTLVSQYIRSIFQDSKGNLWFGTLEEGVVRFDEKTLTYFSNPDGFYSNSVHAICEDKKGNLWFGTDQGLYKYDGQTFRNYNQKDGLHHTDMSRKSLLVDKSGTIWAGTHGGVYQYDPAADEGGKPCFLLFPLLQSVHIAGIMEDQKGNIWFASSDQGVFRYDGKAMVNFNEKEGLGVNYAGGLAEDKSGNVWFTMTNGICKFDGKTFTEYTAKDGLGGTEIWGIYIEQSGIIWITARGSTTRFDPSIPVANPKAFTVFTVEDGINCCVQSMYQDRSNNMWWGAGQGLYRFDGKRFYQVKKTGPW